MRDPLELGSRLVATAGTSAHVIVTSKDSGKDGATHYHIAIVGLNLGLAGTLPLKVDSPVVERVITGMAIPTTTLAAVGYEQGKLRVAIPLPFTLSNEPPTSSYTPAPLRTAAPIIQRRKPTPTPSPTPLPSQTPDPAVSSMPAASPAPASATTSSPAPIPT